MQGRLPYIVRSVSETTLTVSEPRNLRQSTMAPPADAISITLALHLGHEPLAINYIQFYLYSVNLFFYSLFFILFLYSFILYSFIILILILIRRLFFYSVFLRSSESRLRLK